MTLEKIKSWVPYNLPNHLQDWFQTGKTNNNWAHDIWKSYSQSTYIHCSTTKLKVKQGIVDFAKHKWPLHFSRFFEAFRYAGPSLPSNVVTLVVNYAGVSVVDEMERVFLELPFTEITTVFSSR